MVAALHELTLSLDDCRALLRSSDVGRLAVAIHGQPFIFPVNYFIYEDSVIFRTNEGAKLDGVYRSQCVAFEVDGQEFRLEPTISGDKLFFVFGDATNRDETYGAGRFMYSDMPGEDGKVVLDFNKSYSPPCAFNDFSTCPIASPRNRLPVQIRAGEKYDSSLHYSGNTQH